MGVYVFSLRVTNSQLQVAFQQVLHVYFRELLEPDMYFFVYFPFKLCSNAHLPSVSNNCEDCNDLLQFSKDLSG